MKFVKAWQTDKLKTALITLWALTVFFSFFGSAITLLQLPAIGELYPFRLLLPVTALFYLLWMIREKHNPWKTATRAQRICYVLSVLLVIYGSISLLFAIDFLFTFRRLFNLCYNLCYFCMALALCKEKDLFIGTVHSALAAVLIQIPMGIYEVFFKGVFDPIYDAERPKFAFFTGKFQRPVVASGNTNDFAMLLVFVLAVALLYWAWRHREEKCGWIPVAMIAPIYFLISAGDARLCVMAFVMLVAGFVMFALTLKEKKRLVLLLTALLLVFVIFGQNYQKWMPQTNKVTTQWEEPTVVSLRAGEVVGNPTVTLASRSLKDQLFRVDKETGELQINLKYSAGTRLDLLLHAAKCVVQSKGLGVGLGNTEQLAKVNAASRKDGVWNIHCFLARMTGDFGIFFLIPLLLLAVELLRIWYRAFRQSLKKKNMEETMLWIMYLLVLASYPITSTASSDAQNSLAMWLYLAVVVLFPVLCGKEQQEA